MRVSEQLVVGGGPVARWAAEQLARLGFEVELQEVVADRPNVVAIKRGRADYQSFLFNGHLDAVMPVGEWRRDPFQPWVEDGIPTVLYGPGDWNTTPNEGIAIQDLVTAARVYAATAADIVTRPRLKRLRRNGGPRTA